MSTSRRSRALRFSMLVLAIAFTNASAGEYQMRYKVQGVKPAAPEVTFTSHTFTTCGATGPIGPAESECVSAYAGGPAEVTQEGVLQVLGGIQHWRVPVTGTYRIEAAGAGYNASIYQRGARMAGDFTLQGGQVIKLLVGQKSTGARAGSGGSFVATMANEPLLVAGGAGGQYLEKQIIQGTKEQLAAAVNQAYNSTEGQGGYSSVSNSRGGGGFYGNARGYEGGKAFISGGAGGPLSAFHVGGFGGGGSRVGSTSAYAGGGGGYSGGNGGANDSGSGGGSFNSGLNQANQSGANAGNGYIKVTLLK
jgi:hypothetical protein